MFGSSIAFAALLLCLAVSCWMAGSGDQLLATGEHSFDFVSVLVISLLAWGALVLVHTPHVVIATIQRDRSANAS